ncbi:hypothetical protein [Acinetobacter larvae]|uniref:CopG family transcriptional regulator n=1 Tax=Acinetobacter larvae TaxID=1789224 RepID=A0A1B2LZB5_9GAMM|nr:hypothetical protein [Acinetobacter larvae]AOA58302.1 hypothetical protein BFG52_07970 [Acinetobacter larvae]
MPKSTGRFRPKRNEKKTICMSTHLDDEVAEHIATKAYEREWSNSQYLRWLAIQDKKRCEDDDDLTAYVSGTPREQINPFRRTELCEHCERKLDK